MMDSKKRIFQETNRPESSTLIEESYASGYKFALLLAEWGIILDLQPYIDGVGLDISINNFNHLRPILESNGIKVSDGRVNAIINNKSGASKRLLLEMGKLRPFKSGSQSKQRQKAKSFLLDRSTKFLNSVDSIESSVKTGLQIVNNQIQIGSKESNLKARLRLLGQNTRNKEERSEINNIQLNQSIFPFEIELLLKGLENCFISKNKEDLKLQCERERILGLTEVFEMNAKQELEATLHAKEVERINKERWDQQMVNYERDYGNFELNEHRKLIMANSFQLKTECEFEVFSKCKFAMEYIMGLASAEAYYKQILDSDVTPEFWNSWKKNPDDELGVFQSVKALLFPKHFIWNENNYESVVKRELLKVATQDYILSKGVWKNAEMHEQNEVSIYFEVVDQLLKEQPFMTSTLKDMTKGFYIRGLNNSGLELILSFLYSAKLESITQLKIIEPRSRFPCQLAIIGRPRPELRSLSERISEKYNLQILDPLDLIGEALNEAKSKNVNEEEMSSLQKIGLKVKEILEMGNALDNEIFIDLITEKIKFIDVRQITPNITTASRGWILINFPMNLTQYNLLKKRFGPNFEKQIVEVDKIKKDIVSDLKASSLAFELTNENLLNLKESYSSPLDFIFFIDEDINNLYKILRFS